jgi:hypothetical protein
MSAPLEDAARNGVYARSPESDALRVGFSRPEDWWARLDFAPGASIGKAEWLTALAGALRFPDAFGHNWDAAADSLQDLGWHAWRRLVIEVCGAGAFFRTRDGETALEVLAEAATYWKTRGRVFVVLVEGAPRPGVSRS